MKLPESIKKKVMDLAFKYVLLPCVGIGFIVFCYLFSVMFDDKQTYDGGASDFFKWLKDTTTSEISDEIAPSDKPEDKPIVEEK